jgi:hypothetical protein
LVLSGEKDGFFDEIRRRLPEDQQAEYDRFLKDYLDFGSIFAKSEEELAGMNRQIGKYFLVAAGRADETKEDDPPADNGTVAATSSPPLPRPCGAFSWTRRGGNNSCVEAATCNVILSRT